MTVNPAIPDYESPIRDGPVKYLVVHTAECNEYDGADNAISGYLARTPNSSIHVSIDNNSYTPSVPEDRVAWAASNRLINNFALQAEFVGRAGQGVAGWADEFSQAQLRTAAPLYARWAREHGIPIRHGSPEDLRAGSPGFYGHVDSTRAWNNPDGHWDPGPDFPWDQFLNFVRQSASINNPQSTDWFDMATQADLVAAIKSTSNNCLAHKDGKVYECWGFFARHLSPVAHQQALDLQVRDIGPQGAKWWSRFTFVNEGVI